jgi:hypothetical protein
VVRVREGVVDELADMVVGEAVVDVFAVAAALDEAGLAQRFEALADRREVRLGVGELADAALAVTELAEDLEALPIREGSQELGGALEALRADRDRGARRVLVLVRRAKRMLVLVRREKRMLVLVGRGLAGLGSLAGGFCLHHFNNR